MGPILSLLSPRHVHFIFWLKIVHEGMNLGAKQADNFSSKSSLLQFISAFSVSLGHLLKTALLCSSLSPIFVHIIFCLSCLGHLHSLCLTETDYIKSRSLFSLFLECECMHSFAIILHKFLSVWSGWMLRNLARPTWSHSHGYKLEKAGLVLASDFMLPLWDVLATSCITAPSLLYKSTEKDVEAVKDWKVSSIL